MTCGPGLRHLRWIVMKLTPQVISEVLLIEPSVHSDPRGYFVETFRQDLLSEALDEPVNFVQDNESLSVQGVLRGLHFQLPPFAQSKLVRVAQGEILDVVVDIRLGSPTFGQHLTTRLSSANHHQLFIPRGFAHGFVVLSHQALVQYKVDAPYAPAHETGLAFDDAALGIDWQWPLERLIVSAKDRQQPTLAQLRARLLQDE